MPKDCEEIERSFEDVNILRKYGLTLDEKSKFYVDTVVSSNHSFCVFQSEAAIDLIKNRIDPKQRRYLLDGTFQSAAKPFGQLLTISVEYKHIVSFSKCLHLMHFNSNFDTFMFCIFFQHEPQILPVFYILSTSKSAACYKDIFEFIERIFQLNPKQFMTDFECGLRKAIKEVYPKSVLHGCWFHYRKCILRKIKLYGISKLWNKNARNTNPEVASKARKIYKMLCFLPLLPKEHFSAGCKHIENRAAEFNLSSTFGIFFAYFNRTWVVEVSHIIIND